MKFLKYNSSKLVNVNISKYLIDWDREVSKPQKQVKDFLKKYWNYHICCEEFKIPGCLLRVDLLNLTCKIAIEVSPRALHVKYNKFMHGNRSGYLHKLKSDANKMLWAEKSGFKFVELYDEDINNLSKEYIKEKFDIDL